MAMQTHAGAQWETVRLAELAEIGDVHQQVRGTGRGRRYATQQLNRAYVVALASNFQGFARALHTEMATTMVSDIDPAPLRSAIHYALTTKRSLDGGSGSRESLKRDFDKLGIDLIDTLKRDDPSNIALLLELDDLHTWRNAIAHQDFRKLLDSATPKKPLAPWKGRNAHEWSGRTTIGLKFAHRLRVSINDLVQAMDRAIPQEIEKLL